MVKQEDGEPPCLLPPVQSHDQNKAPRPGGANRLSTRFSHPAIRYALLLSPHSSPSPVTVHMGLALLCTSNRAHFVTLTLRSVLYGTNGHATRSSSTFANPSWRRASLSQSIWPSPISPSHGHLNVRAASWATKFNLRPSTSSLNDSDTHEEAAKEAVLEAIKGRQQTDLMLRCESAHRRFANCLNFIST